MFLLASEGRTEKENRQGERGKGAGKAEGREVKRRATVRRGTGQASALICGISVCI